MARALLPAAAVLLVLAGCPRGDRERIAVGLAHLPAFALVLIAEGEGYFAARGLAVEQRRFDTGREALAALAAGEVDAATAYITPVALRAGEDLEILTTLHASTRLTRLLARADRGIAGAKDLAGKRVAVPRGTSGEFFLHTVLAYGGVDEPIAVVDLSPAAAAEALLAGEVDAIVSWPPHVYRARSPPDGTRIVEIANEVYAEISVLAVRGATHRARRGALVKLVAALADAERLVHERPEQAFRALRVAFPGSSEAELRETWERTRLTLGLTHELAAVLERESAWFRSQGRVEGPPLDLGAVLDPDVLAEVDPEAVTFVSPARDPGVR